MIPFPSRWRRVLKMLSRLTQRALGQEPVSRWCETPLADVKPRLQKGQETLVPRWMRELRCCERHLSIETMFVREGER